MSDIYLDRTNMERLMETQADNTDAIYAGIKSMPSAVDGGAATALIAFLVSSGTEASGILADSHRVFAAITSTVLEDATLTETQIQEELGRVGQGLEGL